MGKEFQQITWSEAVEADLRRLVEMAIADDALGVGDLTSEAVIPQDAPGRAAVVARDNGVVAGLRAIPTILAAVDSRLDWTPEVEDGQGVAPGVRLGVLSGPALQMLTAERIVLNVVGRLCGIATLTSRYVAEVDGTAARVYDTRKTTPGWRRLEKYAVRCGGGCNHRLGLGEAVLIKDNHLALGAQSEGAKRFTPGEAVQRAKAFLRERLPDRHEATIVEIEVDTLEQLDDVLPASPDIVLLDNMTTDQLREAVRRRNAVSPSTELEASGGVNLKTIRAIAETGVERISVGALTHSAVAFDVGLDWAADASK